MSVWILRPLQKGFPHKIIMTYLVIGSNMPDWDNIVLHIFIYGQIWRLVNFGRFQNQHLDMKVDRLSMRDQFHADKTYWFGFDCDLQGIGRRRHLFWLPPPESPSKSPPAPVCSGAVALSRAFWSAGRSKWSPPLSADTWNSKGEQK